MKRIIALFLACLMIFALCACGEGEPVPTEPVPTETAPAYTPTSYRNHGKRITVHEMPEKVLVAGPNCAEVFCALGLEDSVIGKCMTNHSRGILEQYKAAYKKIPTVCVGYPTLDDIINSGCDFLYASEWIFSDTLTVKSLEDAGILVYVNDAKSCKDIWNDILDLSRIFSLDNAGAEITEAEAARIDDVRSVITDAEPLKVLVVDSFVGDKIFTAGGDNIETEFIASAGGVNVFEDLEKPWDAVSVEDIVAANPDFIIIHDYKDSGYKSKVQALKDNPELQYLDCIRNERFIKLSLENLMPGVRSALTVETLAHTMFYELFAAAAEETSAPQ